MEFFEWKIAVSSRTNFAGFTILGEARYSERPRCRYCGVEIGRGDWLPPYRIRFEHSRVGDFASDGTSFVLSERCVVALQSEGIEGLRFAHEPVETMGSVGSFIAAFPKPTLTRLDEQGSGMEVLDVLGCRHCRVLRRLRVERLRIDESSWDGKDVFRPSGLFGTVVVTRNFVDVIQNYELKNFHFIHQDDYQEDWSLLL